MSKRQLGTKEVKTENGKDISKWRKKSGNGVLGLMQHNPINVYTEVPDGNHPLCWDFYVVFIRLYT